MGIDAPGLAFNPLYWVFDDEWQYYNYTAGPNGGPGTEDVFTHYGHVHFFMLGFDPTYGQDAFTGFQQYNFQIQDIWGPNSGDPNQQYQYTVVGSPKWYFYLQEVWRRVYVQPWDLKIPSTNPLDMRGVKYDACPTALRKGPFREGRGFSPLFIQNARTQPIDYFTGVLGSQLPGDRTNFCKDLATTVFGNLAPGTNPPYNPATFNPAAYDLDHGGLLYAGGDLVGATPSPAAVPPFSDTLYAWPLVEYQTVQQLNWERFPGWAEAHDIDDTHFGDGWNVNINVPFTDPTTGLYRSPFCPPGTKTVMPVGQYYNNLVSPSTKLNYPVVHYDDPAHPPTGSGDVPFYYDTPAKLPPSLSGQPMTWHNPYGGLLDGAFVQQCLGGICQARATVTLQHRFGGQFDVSVSSVQYLPATQFAGTDQGEPG